MANRAALTIANSDDLQRRSLDPASAISFKSTAVLISDENNRNGRIARAGTLNDSSSGRIEVRAPENG